MGLANLRDIFIKQVSDNQGQIILNNITFQQAGYSPLTPPKKYPTMDMDKFIMAALQLGNEPLSVTTTAAGITLNAENTVLTIVGTVSFLNVQAISVTVNFTEITTVTGAPLEFNFYASLPKNWTFGHSFDFLYGYPFAGLELTQPTYFFSSTKPTSVIWNNAPLSEENLSTLDEGLNFIANINPTGGYLSSPLQWLKSIINQNPVIITGAIDATKMDNEDIIYPDINLFAAIVNSTDCSLSLFKGFLTLSNPTINLAIQRIPDPTSGPDNAIEQTPSVNLGSILTIRGANNNSITMLFKAELIPNSNFITFSLVGPTSLDKSITLDNIIGLFPGGNVAIGDIPTALQKCLTALSLQAIACQLCFNPLNVMSFIVTIGSTSPWKFFNGFFNIKTFNLSIIVLSPFSQAPQKLLTANADFAFCENTNPGSSAKVLNFNVDIVWDNSQNFTVTGNCADQLSLTDLISDVLHDLQLPTISSDTLNINFDDFTINIAESTDTHQYEFSAIANMDVNIFGHPLLSMQNMSFAIHVESIGSDHIISSVSKKWTASFNGIIFLMGLGFQVSAVFAQDDDVTLKINMTNTTVGQIINFFVSLISSGMRYNFPEPWSKLAAINMDALVLEFKLTSTNTSLTSKIISVEYHLDIDFEFIHISWIKLTYDENVSKPEQKITIAIMGNFLGKSYGNPLASDPWQNSLSWQPLCENPPEVAGNSSKFVLRYLGIGQHISFNDSSNLTTTQAVLNELENTLQPLPATSPSNGNMMSQLNGLKYDANGGWLLGLDCTIVDTVSMGIIFNDPALYGLHLSLSGSKAKIFAGLSFDVLYRKVTNDLGEYSIQLKLPNAMRHFALGDAQITLPMVGVDIFTNGNFKIDLGFPYNHDFSGSFSILISPVVGTGGFYLAWLDNATSSQVPQITNGNFHPVIEFGFGLNVGLGASLSVGPLSAGISVTVLGILQGTFAYFEPTNKTLSHDIFYKCQGMIGIQGRLWGQVNFYVVKASIDILIDAIASIAFEHYQSTSISVLADVDAEVSVKVLFVTIHHSFSVHINEQFTLGSASTPPWSIVPATPSRLLLSNDSALLSARLSSKANNLIANWDWNKTSSFRCANNPQSLPLYLTPVVTTTEEGPNNTITAKLVIALFINNTDTPNDPATSDFTKFCLPMLVWPLQTYFQTNDIQQLNASTINYDEITAIFAQVTSSVPDNIFTKIVSINDVQSQLIWHALYLQGYLTEGGEITSKFTSNVQLNLPLNFMTSALATSIVELISQWQSNASFSYQALSNYLSANFVFKLQERPTQAGSDNAVAGIVFPMPSALVLNTDSNVSNNKNSIDFSQFNLVTNTDYLHNLNEYLAMAIGVGPQQKSQEHLYNKVLEAETSQSMAQLIFQDYFFLMIRTALQLAKNLLKCYPHTIQTSDTLVTIASKYSSDIAAMITLNQDNDKTLQVSGLLLIHGFKLLSQANTTLTNLASCYKTGSLNAGKITPVAMQPVDIANNNLYLCGLLQTGAIVSIENISYTPPQNPITQNSLAAQFYTRPENIVILNRGTPQTRDTIIPALTRIQITKIQFQVSVTATPNLNTVQKIAIYFGISPPQLITFNPSLSSYSLNQAIPDTTTINIPNMLYIVPPNDPISILNYFGIFNERLTLKIDFNSTPINIPKAIYVVQSSDSIFSIARYLDISIPILLPAISSIPLTNNLYVTMPDIVHSITEKQTLQQIAMAYDVTLMQLAITNQTTQGILAVKATWHIPKATVTVAQLLQKMTENIDNGAQANKSPVENIAGMLNRFMLHGLRIPGPQVSFPESRAQWATLPTDSIYALTGQQLNVSLPQGATQFSYYNLTLTPSSLPVSWLNLPSPTWIIALTSTSYELTNLKQIIPNASAVNYTLPTAVSSYHSSAKKFNFQHGITWQTSLAPSYLVASNPATQDAINPIIWLFPQSLLTIAQSLSQTTLPLDLATVVQHNISISAQSSINGYVWGTLLNLKIQKPKVTKGIYNIKVDTANRHLLANILNSSSRPQMQLFLLYAKDQTTDSSGLISDISNTNDLQTIQVINTNSSLQSDIANCANLSTSQKFLQVLFEDSVMQAGACYLTYRTSLNEQGLPDHLFGNNAMAEIKLLVTYSNDTEVRNYHNCVITQNNINTQQQVFSATAKTLLATIPAIAPGHFGFELSWQTPPLDNYIGSLYHLLGYNIQDNKEFVASPVGLPISPKTDGANWIFKRILPIQGFIENNSTLNFIPLPLPEENPYTNIMLASPTDPNAKPKAIQLAFVAHDMFGNKLTPSGLASPLDISLYYTDVILGINQWPAVSASYSFTTKDSIPNCQIFLDFSACRYSIDPLKPETAIEALKRITADLQQYKTIYYQLGQNDVSLTLDCSIGEISGSLDKNELVNFVAKIYTYISSLSYLYNCKKLSGLLLTITQNTTWQEVLSKYYVTSDDLAEINKNNTVLLQKDSSINLPICYTVQYQDNLNIISKLTTLAPFNQKAAVSITQIATINQTLTILKPGVMLTIPTTPAISYIIQDGDTLAAIVANFAAKNITISNLASANADVIQLFKEGARIVLYTTNITNVATNADLLSIATQAAAMPDNKGQDISVAQLMQVNYGYVLANSAQIIIPQHILLNAQDYPQGLAVAEIDSLNNNLASLAQKNNINIIDIYNANMDLVNILSPSTTITFEIVINNTSKITVTATTRINETLNTFYAMVLSIVAQKILDYVNANSQQSIQITIGATGSFRVNVVVNGTPNALILQLKTAFSVADFAMLISTQTLLVTGGFLLMPPGSISYQAKIDSTSVSHQTIFVLNVNLNLARDQRLINSDPNMPQDFKQSLSKATTTLAPVLDGNNHSIKLSLQGFATNFATIFNGWQLAVAKTKQSNKQTLWVLPLDLKNIQYNIAIGSQAFYLPPPLATTLLSYKNIPIYNYNQQKGVDTDTPFNLDFTDIDLDNWARQFLSAFDRIFSPEYLVALNNLPNGSNYLSQLLTHKQNLAQTISSSIQPVLQKTYDNQQERQQYAQQTLRERLLENLADVYNIDSIVQYAVNVIAPGYEPDLSLAMVAEYFNVPIPTIILANIYAKIKPQIMLNLPNNPFYITNPKGDTLLNVLDTNGYLDCGLVPSQSLPAEIFNNSGLFTPTTTLAVTMGVLSVSVDTKNTFGITVPQTHNNNSITGILADIDNSNGFMQNCGYSTFNAYYFATVIRDLKGQSGTPIYAITNAITMSWQGKNLSYTPQVTDCLDDIFNGLIKNEDDPPDFIQFVLNIIGQNIFNPGYKFNFIWQFVSYAAYKEKFSPPDLAPLFIGKPIAGNYKISQESGENTLSAITKNFSQIFPVSVLYVANAVQYVQNIFIADTVIGNYKPTANDSLATLVTQLKCSKLSDLINSKFNNTSFTELPIFIPGKELNLSWISYGQEYCLETVADALNIDVPSLIWANLFLNVDCDNSKTLKPLINYLTDQKWFTNNEIVNIPYKEVIANPTLLDPIAPIGMLSYIENPDQQQKTIQISGFTSLTDLAQNSVFINNSEINHGFHELYMAGIIKDISGIFNTNTQIKLDIGDESKTYIPNKQDTLTTVANQFQPLSFKDFIIEINGVTNIFDPATIFNFEWQYVNLDNMNASQTADTLVNIAQYFQCEPVNLIAANLYAPNLLKIGTIINCNNITYTISKDDTFYKVIKQFVADWNDSLDIPATFLSCINITSNPSLLNPFAKVYLLKNQPGTSLSAAKSSLQNGPSYLTFLFQEANAAEERVFLDLNYKVSGVECNRKAIDNMPGYFDYDALTLVTPQSFDMGQIEIPVPLRSYPITPILSTQQASAYNPSKSQSAQELSLDMAKSWNYLFSYWQKNKSQDAIELCVDFNNSSTSYQNSRNIIAEININQPENNDNLQVLFSALAQFVYAEENIFQNLNYLIGINTTPNINAPNIIIAINSFLTLVENVVTAWENLYNKSLNIQDQNITQYRCTVVEEYTDGNILNIIVNTQNILPGGINLPYIEADPNYWVPDSSSSTQPTQDSNFVIYSFQQKDEKTIPPAKQIRTVKFLNEFDIFSYQSVWAGISLSRNAQLLANFNTNPCFIYQTPQVRFSQPIMPLMDRRDVVRFLPDLSFASTIEQQLQNHLNNLFDQLFGSTTITSWEISIACRYNYPLSGINQDGFVINIPMVFSAKYQIVLNNNQFVDDLVQNIISWQQSNGFVFQETACFNLDLSVFSSQDPTKPILHLHNVHLDCFPSPIQKQRILPPSLLNENLVNMDGVNPLVTNINQNTNILPNTVTNSLLAYGAPVRIKSWISGMVWADNTTPYYTNSGKNLTTAISRQQPVYADPIIGFYVCQLPGDKPNYNDYFSQSGQTDENDMSIYGDPGWQAGFHLSMPNPAINIAAAYNSGQGQYTYNNDALVYNAAGDGWDPPDHKWVAATSNTDNKPESFKVNPTPPSSYQVGLCQYGCWRDTLSITPATKIALATNIDSLTFPREGFIRAFAPSAARLAKQSDCHAEFVISNEAQIAPNQILKMTMTQGSPCTQFIAAGIDAVRIAGIFNPQMQTGYVFKSGEITSPYTISGLQNNSDLNYVIIYQQVNFFNMEKVDPEQKPAQRMNWVAFAIYWDPSTTSLQLDKENNMAFYLCFNKPEWDNYFVIAGLPNQMANKYNGEPYQLSLAKPWADFIGQYAFNFITDTSVTYYVGQDKEGNSVAANEVKTYYKWQFQTYGPVLKPDTSIMLLQPHHYATFCDGRNRSVLDNSPDFIEFGSTDIEKATNKYWISRGKLEALNCSEFSTTYIYPNILPCLPYFNYLDNKHKEENSGDAYNIAQMAAAMSGYDWVAEFPGADGKPQNAPATTCMGNSTIMQDSYNAVKGFLKSAKLIMLLLQMTKSGHFNDANIMQLIDGTTIPAGGKSIYGVGNRFISAKDTETFTPGGALHDFIKNLMEAFTYYFNFNPQHLCQDIAKDTNKVTAQSYYYSFYDNANHHLFLYPASGAGSYNWPTNAKNAGPRYDGYGTVSMLNDHAYTYGYLIAAAAMLGLTLRDPALQKLSYKPFDLAHNSMGKEQNVCSDNEWQEWSSWIPNWTPIIDQLIMDIAYDPAVQGFKMMPGLSYPKMEYIDLWTSTGWTDGFLTNGSVQGHNVNSPWEQMQAWAGILLWGHATQRTDVLNLGIYLYTTGFYNLEAYHYNTIKTYIPQQSMGDYGAYDSYLPKATNDFYPGFAMSWHDLYTPLANAKQAFSGKTMWDTMMSDKAPHQSAHVTYFYQGNVRSDTTYWNSPVGLQITAIYPHNPYMLAVSRNKSYMSDWAAAIQFQNSRSYYKIPYPTSCNLLYAQLGLNFSLASQDCSSQYNNKTATASDKIMPIPYKGSLESGYSTDYAPTGAEKTANPQTNAFNYLVFDDKISPYNWFWQKCAAINMVGTDADKVEPPWISNYTGETLSMHVPSDKSATETLLYFYHYDRYGSPDFSVYATSATPVTAQNTTIIQPMAMSWIKNGIRSFVVYNSNSVEIAVSFDTSPVTDIRVPAHSMLVYPSAVIYSFMAQKTASAPDLTFDLCWDVRGASKITLSNGADFNQDFSEAIGSISVTPKKENPTYTLTITDNNNQQINKTVTCNLA